MPEKLIVPGSEHAAKFATGEVARLTLQFAMHQQQRGEPATSATKVATLLLQTTEQGFGPRRVEVTEEPQPIDFGWLKRPGMLFLENATANNPNVNPTEAEREALQRQILKVLVRGEVIGLVPPGAGLPFNVPDPTAIRLQSMSGTLRVMLTAFAV